MEVIDFNSTGSTLKRNQALMKNNFLIWSCKLKTE